MWGGGGAVQFAGGFSTFWKNVLPLSSGRRKMSVNKVGKEYVDLKRVGKFDEENCVMRSCIICTHLLSLCC
jgi:hypothetical protein